jgi:hypothetical protein
MILSSTVIGLGVAVFIPVSRHVDIKKLSPNPYPKAELAFALQVLLSIIVNVNSVHLTKREAEKEGRQIYLCDCLKMNELFAVAVLRGLIVPREFILQPMITGAFGKAVRDTIFKGDSDMNDKRIRSTLENPCLGYAVFDSEHVLTECIQSERLMFWLEKPADVFACCCPKFFLDKHVQDKKQQEWYNFCAKQ